jgi:hypothetical protein
MQEALKKHVAMLKSTIRKIQDWIRNGSASACPITVMQTEDPLRQGFLSVCGDYSATVLAAGEAPSWSKLRVGALAQALLKLAPLRRVLQPGVQGRLQFRDLLDHVRMFTQQLEGHGEVIMYCQVLLLLES